MIPLADRNPASRPAIMGWLIIAACVIVFVYQVNLPSEGALASFFYTYGMVPLRVFEGQLVPPGTAEVPAILTVFTSMFLHGDILHLGGNMLFLWVFGDNIEDRMGIVGFVLFYLLCGVAAAMTQAFVDPGSAIPMIGASGAISGILGAYLFLYPTAAIHVLIFITVVTLPAVVVLGLWFVLQLANGLMTPPGAPGVAFWAHIGGFVAGVVLHRLFVSSR